MTYSRKVAQSTRKIQPGKGRILHERTIEQGTDRRFAHKIGSGNYGGLVGSGQQRQSDHFLRVESKIWRRSRLRDQKSLTTRRRERQAQKLLAPAARKKAVGLLQEGRGFSQRRACQVFRYLRRMAWHSSRRCCTSLLPTGQLRTAIPRSQ
jgi:hypothetical protein